MKKTVVLLASVLLLNGCATWHSPVPKDYTGPTVELKDTGFTEGGTKGQFFAATEIDGKKIYNSMAASRAKSYGHGFALTAEYVSRHVPVKHQKVKLVGTHQTAAPIHAMFSQLAGTYFNVEKSKGSG